MIFQEKREEKINIKIKEKNVNLMRCDWKKLLCENYINK